MTFTLSDPESWLWPVDYRKKKSKVLAWHIRLLGHFWDPDKDFQCLDEL